MKALLKTTEGESLAVFIKAIGSGKKAAGRKGPAVLIVASLLESLFRKIFISGIIVDNGDRAGAPNILIVGGNIVLRVGDVDFDLALVMIKDLLFV